nr:hypothetical protein [Sphingomonas rhizophila]
MTNRPIDLRAVGRRVDVRRLMYQSLIWLGHTVVRGEEARSLCTALDVKDLQGLPDTLVDGVRRDAELCGNLFRRQMLVHEGQAFALPR